MKNKQPIIITDNISFDFLGVNGRTRRIIRFSKINASNLKTMELDNAVFCLSNDKVINFLNTYLGKDINNKDLTIDTVNYNDSQIYLINVPKEKLNSSNKLSECDISFYNVSSGLHKKEFDWKQRKARIDELNKVNGLITQFTPNKEMLEKYEKMRKEILKKYGKGDKNEK